jgi:hypothetical protein
VEGVEKQLGEVQKELGLEELYQRDLKEVKRRYTKGYQS